VPGRDLVPSGTIIDVLVPEPIGQFHRLLVVAEQLTIAPIVTNGPCARRRVVDMIDSEPG
jgi:hypothetical protein